MTYSYVNNLLTDIFTVSGTVLCSFFFAAFFVTKYVWKPMVDETEKEIEYEYLYMDDFLESDKEEAEEENGSDEEEESEKENESDEGEEAEEENESDEKEESEEKDESDEEKDESDEEKDESDEEKDESDEEKDESEEVSTREDGIVVKELTDTSYVKEQTPKGSVYMFYNKENESFWYYADTKDISYKYLDTVARRFCIEFDCKSFYVNTLKEYKKGVKKMKEQIKSDKVKKEEEEKEEEREKEEEEEKNVFAKFKHYNQQGNRVGSRTNVTKKYYILRESANRYTHKGRIEDFKLLKENTDTYDSNISQDEFKQIDFATYKQEIEENKKNL
jgi:hypothetical protein